jgi:hypothetical protein
MVRNGNIIDNQIENLQLMTRGEHSSHHNKKDLSNRLCCECHGNKTRIDSDGYQIWHKNPLNKNEYLCNNCYMIIKVTQEADLYIDDFADYAL